MDCFASLAMTTSVPRAPRNDGLYFFTSGQREAFQRLERFVAGNGREQACNRPSGPLDSAGFLTSNRYMSCTMRPSSRMRPFLAKKFVDRRLLHDLDDGRRASVVPAAFTAFK